MPSLPSLIEQADRVVELNEDKAERVTASLIDRIAEIDEADWCRCAEADDNPFLSYGFLSALEDSGCVGPGTGWQACHLVMSGKGGAVCGVAPLYLKGHSQGEYVFDHGWAAALEEAGGAYYPKLQCSVPFTPVTGPRLLAAGNEDIRAAMMDVLAALPNRLGASSVHMTFALGREAGLGESCGWLRREGLQYHWYNADYEDFSAFLASLTSRKRKAIRKERERAGGEVAIHCLEGQDIRSEHLDSFFAFYLDTGGRKWGRPYLNREFFTLLHDRMADQMVLMMARDGAHWVAGALNIRGRDALYGRYWGCLQHYPMLHFELCYYCAIEYAIKHGLSRVEAGAQGEHKLQRGYQPVATHSLHWIEHQGLRQAVARFLAAERPAVAQEIEVLQEYTPFHRI